MGESKGSFTKWKEKINKKVNTLGSKTSYAMDRSKARKQIAQLQEDIDVLKREVGDIVYNRRHTEWTLELVALQLEQIEEKETLIVQLEVHIEELNELSRLAGLKVEEETARSSELVDVPVSVEGVETELETPAQATFTCPNCKQTYEETEKLCNKCGYQLAE